MWVSVDYPYKQNTHVTVGEGQEPHCLMTITASFRLRLVIVGNCDISIRVKHILKWDQKNPNKQTTHSSGLHNDTLYLGAITLGMSKLLIINKSSWCHI